MHNSEMSLLLYKTIRADQQRLYAKLEREQRMQYTQLRRNTLRRLAEKVRLQLKTLVSASLHRKQITPSSTATS